MTRKSTVKSMRSASIAALCAATLFLSGCASSAPATTASEPEPGSIKLSIAPVLFGTAAQYAVDGGLFEKAGIKAEIAQALNPAETMPRLLNGEIQFAVMDIQSAMLAQSEGMPIVINAPGIKSATITEDTFGFGNLVVAKDGPVRSPGDLEGRTIGVNSVGNQSWLDTMTVLKRNDVDVDKVDFVEIPAARALASLRQGQVDSIVLPEPFATAAFADGGDTESILRLDTGIPGVPSFGWVSTKEFAAANPDLLESFNTVILDANGALNRDRPLNVETAKSFLDYPADILEAAYYPQYAESMITEADLKAISARMVDFGVIDPAQVPDPLTLLGNN